MSITINILIISTNISNLQRMLDSLSNQINNSDCLTIICNNNESINLIDKSRFNCEINNYYEPSDSIDWEFQNRNKYAQILSKRDTSSS